MKKTSSDIDQMAKDKDVVRVDGAPVSGAVHEDLSLDEEQEAEPTFQEEHLDDEDHDDEGFI